MDYMAKEIVKVCLFLIPGVAVIAIVLLLVSHDATAATVLHEAKLDVLKRHVVFPSATVDALEATITEVSVLDIFLAGQGGQVFIETFVDVYVRNLELPAVNDYTREPDEKDMKFREAGKILNETFTDVSVRAALEAARPLLVVKP